MSPINVDQIKSLRVLMPVLIYELPETFIPEIVEAFGQEQALRFIDFFGGVSVEVPSRETLLRLIEDVDIYVSLETEDSMLMLDRLSKKYEVSTTRISSRRKKIQDIMGLVDGQE